MEAHFIFTKKQDGCAQKYYQFLRKKLSTANCTLLLFSSAIIKSLLMFTDKVNQQT